MQDAQQKMGPIKVQEVELSRPLEDFSGLSDYRALKLLVRFHGVPLGYVQLPLYNGRCRAADIGRAILDHLSWNLVRCLLNTGLTNPIPPTGLKIEELLGMKAPEYKGSQPLVTVAVCTRDRPKDLALCLKAIRELDYPELDIVVVDNAPSAMATQRLVRQDFPEVRYICEPRPGLDWARNRAIFEARGEIIAYTDDDVLVDPGWVRALVRVFTENPEVMVVTGLVVPYELETDAQILFEMYGGFGRGFERKWYRLDVQNGAQETYHIGSGVFGTGANMAYRRCLFDMIGEFDPALDVGTVTNGGGDLEMFFRVLQEGHTLVYEPSAIVRHRHRREYKQLRTQLTNNGIGFYSYLVRSAKAYTTQRFAILKLGLWWLWWWNIRRLLISLLQPMRFPRDLILAELKGSLFGLFRYQRAKHNAEAIVRTFVHETNTSSTEHLKLSQLSIDGRHRSGASTVMAS
jgi:GT2 family glycosyltransferase